MDLTLKAVVRIYLRRIIKELELATNCNKSQDYEQAAKHMATAVNLQNHLEHELSETTEEGITE